MRTLLLSLGFLVALNAFGEVLNSWSEYLKHSEKVLGSNEGPALLQVATAAEMKAKSQLEQQRILSLLRITPEIMEAGPVEKIVDEIRKQFCNDAQREEFTKEFVEPIKRDYDTLKEHHVKWEQKLVELNIKYGGVPRPGINPGRQSEFFKNTDKLRGQKPPKLPSEVHTDAPIVPDAKRPSP